MAKALGNLLDMKHNRKNILIEPLIHPSLSYIELESSLVVWKIVKFHGKILKFIYAQLQISVKKINENFLFNFI